MALVSFLERVIFVGKAYTFIKTNWWHVPALKVAYIVTLFLMGTVWKSWRKVGVQNYTPSYKLMNNLKSKDVGYLPCQEGYTLFFYIVFIVKVRQGNFAANFLSMCKQVKFIFTYYFYANVFRS